MVASKWGARCYSGNEGLLLSVLVASWWWRAGEELGAMLVTTVFYTLEQCLFCLRSDVVNFPRILAAFLEVWGVLSWSLYNLVSGVATWPSGLGLVLTAITWLSGLGLVHTSFQILSRIICYDVTNHIVRWFVSGHCPVIRPWEQAHIMTCNFSRGQLVLLDRQGHIYRSGNGTKVILTFIILIFSMFILCYSVSTVYYHIWYMEDNLRCLFTL